jgi:hypothetical protein
MRGASRTDNDARLAGRNAQTLSWAAPLPDFSRDVRGSLVRNEWETRDTINNRVFADTMSSGPKAVTSATLSAHPSNGAMTMNPSSGRQDQRPYDTGQYFPDKQGHPGARPERPSHSLFQNSWLDGFDVESRDVTRELRGAVKEENRSRDADISHRLVGRTFDHQWLPSTFGTHVAQRIDASVALRPAIDDYQKTWRPGGQ